MIGGTDVIIPAPVGPAALEACARLLGRHWLEIRFEDAITGEKYRDPDDIPFGEVRELLAYRDAGAEAAWDAGRPDSPENSMLNLIARPGEITVVLDDPGTGEMRSLLGSLRDLLDPRTAATPAVSRA